MADVEITPLHLAALDLPDFHPEAPGPCDVFGFLVRDGDFHALVDTGVGDGSDLIDRLYRPRRADLDAALRSAGLPRAPDAVVSTHLHFDHCGNHRRFAGVPIYVQEAELEAANEPSHTVRDWVHFPGASYRAVRGRHVLSEHVELVPTPGHTAGHQSVVVRSGGGVDLIVAQAAYTAAEFGAARDAAAPVPEGTPDAAAYRASRTLLHALEPRRAFFSHDPSVWRRSDPGR